MRTPSAFGLTIALFSLIMTGCTTTAPVSESDKAQLHDEVETALSGFTRRDPSLQDRIDNAYGYAVFPSIGKGGAILGGAFGRGEVFEQGDRVGYVTLTQGTIGAQLGGQTFSELILFKNKQRLDELKAENFSFSAEVSAVAATAGAAKKAKYNNGVLVFVKSKGGLMAEASVGGQKFDFVPAQ